MTSLGTSPSNLPASFAARGRSERLVESLLPSAVPEKV
jgi:hypothetical protein